MSKHTNATEMILDIVDEGSFIASEKASYDPTPYACDLKESYREKYDKAKAETGLDTCLLWGEAVIEGKVNTIVASDFNFLGASFGMGEVYSFAQAVENAVKRHTPLIWLAKGGGMRMWEGIHSLLAMPRFMAERKKLEDCGVPMITVAYYPLCAGVQACAAQADIVLAEENALIGFAGPRVVESTEKYPLPEGFQSARYAFRNGQVDGILSNEEIRSALGRLLTCFQVVESNCSETEIDMNFSEKSVLDAWECVEKARKDKVVIRNLANEVFDDFFELHGDRIHSDDPAVFGGLAKIGGKTVMLVAHDNVNPKMVGDAVNTNYNMAHPAGHRKTLRLVGIAEKWGFPIVSFIDTPGAYPDVKSEAEGQGGVLGRLIATMLGVKVPTISFIVGEGGSGGAVALACADRLYMLDSSYYSVITPEGAASILYKDLTKAPEMAEKLRLSPSCLLDDGVIDGVIPANPDNGILSDLIRRIIIKDMGGLKTDEVDMCRRCRWKQ